MTKRSELLLVIVWMTVAACIVYLATGRPSLGIDDAQIFFTYAQNVAAGKGLLYSPGVPPAEGYTSTLWTAICALMFYLHANEIGVLVVSVLLIVVTQLLALRLIDTLLSGRSAWQARFIYVVLITASPAYLSWTTITLMDTGIWSTLIVSMVYVLLLPPVTRAGWLAAGAAFCLAQLARPEATVVGPAVLALLWLKLHSQRRSCAPVWGVLGAMIATTLALTAFRMAYFGYPLPSTYYAKVSSSTWYNLQIGFGYLARYVLGGNVAFVAALVCVPFGWRLLVRVVRDWPRAMQGGAPFVISDRLDDACQLLAAVGLLMLALPISVGGDHFSLSRFYQPAWPVLCLLLAFACVRLAASARFAATRIAAWNARRVWAVPAAVACLAVLLSCASLKDSWLGIARHGSPLAPEFRAGLNGERIGEAIDAVFASSRIAPPTIGVVAAGGVARTYRGPIIDLMGLNNAFIAHFPGDRIGVKDHAAFEKAAFYQLPVDMVISSPAYPWDDVVLKRIFYDPRFTSSWRFGVVYLKADPAVRYESFYSTKFLKSLDADDRLAYRDSMVFNPASGAWERVPVPVPVPSAPVHASGPSGVRASDEHHSNTA
ncbi:hypothetical protein [Paraburkholderia bannensis]|uniref:hypothetical protein n=1 Tax=Paraburkholderia bannensis TaxID=765414 RepID=UPI002AC31343|nr:hypothetical protein [Paraburkholderia bannensis]